MNTELSNNSNIIYSGRVQITLKLGATECRINRHNEGLPALFRLLTYAIAGEPCDVGRPTKIDIRSADGTVSKLATVVKISSVKPIKNLDGTFSVRSVALLQDNNLLSGQEIEASDIMVLMSNNYMLAKVKLTEDEAASLNSIQSATNLTGQIEWTMTIKNASSD